MDREKIFTVITNNFYKILEETRSQPIHEDLLIQEAGLDSLEAIEIISLSMKQLNIKVPLKELIGIKSIRQLVDLFVKNADQSMHEIA